MVQELQELDPLEPLRPKRSRGLRDSGPIKPPTWLEAIKLGLDVQPEPTLLDAIKGAPTTGESLQGAAANVGRAVAETPINLLYDAPAILGSAISKPIVEALGGEPRPASETRLGKWGAALRGKVAQALPVPESVEKNPTFLNRTLPQALGSTVGFAATGGLGGTAGIAVTGALSQGASAYQEAKERSADDETALLAFAASLPIGMTEAIPLGRLFSRINRASNGGVARVLGGMAAQAGEEGIQEAGAQALSNLVAQHTGAPERKIIDGLLESGAAGAIVGALFGGVGGALQSRSNAERVDLVLDPENAGDPAGKAQEARSEPAAVDPALEQGKQATDAATTPPTSTSKPPDAAPTLLDLVKQQAAEMEAERADQFRDVPNMVPGAAPVSVSEPFGNPEQLADEPAAFPWEAPPPTDPQSALRDEGVRARLSEMAGEAGWAQKGGELTFDIDRNVTGRTTWIPKADWWTTRPEGTTERQVKKVIEKVLADPDVELSERDATVRDWLLHHSYVEPALEPGSMGMPAEMPKGKQIGTDITGAPIFSKEERGPLARPDAGLKKPKATQLGAFDEQGGLFEQQAEERDSGLPERLGAPALPGGGITVQPAPGETQIGANMAGTLEEKTSARVSAPQVVESLAKVMHAAGMKTPVRKGFLRGRKSKGEFVVKPEVVRLKVANDIAVAAHEVAHAFEKQVFGLGGAGKQAKAVDPAAEVEVRQLGALLYGAGKPAKFLRAEGFAEFARLYFTNDVEAKARAPKFHEWFEGTFLPSQPAEIQQSIAQAKQAATTWRMQGSKARASESVVDKGSARERAKKLAHTASRFLSMEQQIDALDPLAKLSKEAEEIGGPLPIAKNPHKVADALRLTHDARTEQMVSKEMIDLAGNPVGPSLRSVVEPIKGRYRDFTLYLVARRAEKLWTDPDRGPRNPGLSLEDSQQIIKELGSPEFEAAAQGVYDWYDGVMDYAAEASPEFARVVERIREVDPGSYIPLQRVFDAAEAEFLKRKDMGVSAQGGSLSARLKGSGRQIKDPFPELIAKARRTVLQAHQRMVLDAVLDLSKLEGFGHLVEGPLPKGRVPLTIDAEQAVAAIEKASGEKLGDLKDALSGETLTLFMPAQKLPGGAKADPIFSVMRDGQMQWFQLDERLFRALAGMDTVSLHPALDFAFGAPARAFRLGTTGLRASFSLVTNPLRDLQTFYLNTQSHRLAPALFVNWFERMLRAGVNLATLGKTTDPAAEAWIRLGGQMAQSLGQDVPHTRRAARQLFQTRTERVLSPGNLYDGIRDAFQFPESAPRAAELVEVGRRIGWKPGQPMTLDQSLQLLRAGKQVTTDFSAAGEFARVMNQMVPFYNAAIQGPRAALRAARRSPAQFAFRATQLAALSLALWWQYKDEEWYREKTAGQKFGFWHFPYDGPNGPELIKIPRGQEIGAQTALVEALADSWYREDPKAASEFIGEAFKQMNPFGLPPVLEETAEQLANVDFFTEAPIVPQYGAGSLQQPDAEQFSEYTSRAAVVMGGLFDVSPRRIDHAIRGLGGPVASDLFELLGLGPPEQEREEEPSDTPIIGRLWERGGAMGTRPRSIDELYDALEAARLRQHSKRSPEDEQARQLRLVLDDAAKAVSALSAVRRETSQVKAKRELMREALQIARDALAQVKQGDASRPAAQNARKSAEAREKALK